MASCRRKIKKKKSKFKETNKKLKNQDNKHLDFFIKLIIKNFFQK